MNVREEFAHLSRQELLDRVYEIASKLEIESGSCSQSTVGAIHQVVGIDENVVKASTSLCGGIAMQGAGNCGAVLGGIMALDCLFGRSCNDFLASKTKPLVAAQKPAKKFFEAFYQKYRTIECREIMRQFFGRSFYFEDIDDSRKALKLGAHSAQGCASVVGNAARFVLETILDTEVTDSSNKRDDLFPGTPGQPVQDPSVLISAVRNAIIQVKMGSEMNGIFQYIIEDYPDFAFYIGFDRGKGYVSEGTAEKSNVVIGVTSTDLIQMLTGALSATDAFAQGKIAITGDISYVLNLESLFSNAKNVPVTEEPESFGCCGGS
ncbi:MAG: C-GCAxxG-C-C family (seleno)protein [Chitinophagales bacterium]